MRFYLKGSRLAGTNTRPRSQNAGAERRRSVRYAGWRSSFGSNS